jgi:nucleoside-diphosphate-sugar epimerase
VVGLARSREKAEKRFAHQSGRRDLHFVFQDVCEPVRVDGPVDFVIHAASQASPKYYGVDPVGTLSANVIGSHRLLTLACQKQSQAYLFFSSSEVYGRLEQDEVGIRETDFGGADPAQVRACYAEGKRMGETMCVSWAKQYGVPAKIVRPFHTYGPGMSLDDGRVYADFVADVLAGRDLTLSSDGAARRAFCYLADAVAGFFTVLLKGAVGEAYNVGNPEGETSILELAKLLAGLCSEKRLQVRTDTEHRRPGYLPSAVDRHRPNVEKIGALGWPARVKHFETPGIRIY